MQIVATRPVHTIQEWDIMDSAIWRDPDLVHECHQTHGEIAIDRSVGTPRSGNERESA